MRTLAEVDILTPDQIRLLTELKQRILAVAPDATVALYGSTARGDRSPDSDYDVLVITDRRLSHQERREIYRGVGELERPLDIIISLAIFSQDEWSSPISRGSPYYDAVVSEGIAI